MDEDLVRVAPSSFTEAIGGKLLTFGALKLRDVGKIPEVVGMLRKDDLLGIAGPFDPANPGVDGGIAVLWLSAKAGQLRHGGSDPGTVMEFSDLLDAGMVGDFSAILHRIDSMSGLSSGGNGTAARKVGGVDIESLPPSSEPSTTAA